MNIQGQSLFEGVAGDEDFVLSAEELTQTSMHSLNPMFGSNPSMPLVKTNSRASGNETRNGEI